MNDYGSFLGEIGDHAEAERMQREALALGRELLGNRSIPVANLLNNLGVTLSLLGRRRDAEATFREAFDRHADILGANHWRTRNAARNVGRSLALQQRYADGVAWMDRALEVSIGARRDRDPGRLGIASQRSVMLFHLGRREDAIRELRGQTEALAAMKTDQAESVRVWVNLLLARALNDTGRPAEAEPMLAATVSWLERFPADHPRRAEADCERARSQLLQRDSAAGPCDARSVSADLSSLGTGRTRDRRRPRRGRSPARRTRVHFPARTSRSPSIAACQQVGGFLERRSDEADIVGDVCAAVDPLAEWNRRRKPRRSGLALSR